MEFWSTMASLLGLFAFLQTIFPPKLRMAIVSFSTTFFSSFSSYVYFDITEIDGVNTNELYNAVQLYLSSYVSATPNSNTRLSLTRPLNSTAVTFGLPNNASISDEFNGVSLQWEHTVTPRQLQSSFPWRILPEEKRGFTLKIKKQHKPIILNSYLDHIVEKANEIRRRNQDRYLFTNPRGGGGSFDSMGCNPWEAVPFKHPSTFETLAIDPIKKQQIMEDLQDFAKNGKLFYHKTGRAWKRGYLLYGPPGTGKSSLIAAMANFLGFDIYDLELTEVQNNSELKKLLMKTTPKSIIVIEDIDCSIDLTNRKNSSHIRNSSMCENGGNRNSITLSGLLNFTDGLWSCCGSEKIFVFTTNHIEKLDPALVRSGRMDMHIFMSYCSFPALKILLRNYLDWDEEEEEEDWDVTVLKELEQRIEKVEMSPADISEILIKNRREKGRAMRRVLEALNIRGNKKSAINGVSRKKLEEDEEYEKRAVENDKDGRED